MRSLRAMFMLRQVLQKWVAEDGAAPVHLRLKQQSRGRSQGSGKMRPWTDVFSSGRGSDPNGTMEVLVGASYKADSALAKGTRDGQDRHDRET